MGIEQPEANAKTSELLEQLEKQNHRCALSGRKLKVEETTSDHIVPISAGGENSIDNVWFVREEVNNMKGTMALDEFIALCRDVVKQTRYQNRDTFKQPRSHEGEVR